MTQLPVHIISRATVESITERPPIPYGDLNNYLDSRPGILDDGNCDIFQPNCRSERQAYTRFDLFDIKDHVESGTVVVFPPWLELFENYGVRHHIAACIDWLKANFQSNPVVVAWNHDRDQSTVPELQDLPENFFVLCYNTSQKSPNDIVLPFWNVATNQTWRWDAERPLQGGFYGYVGGLKVRQRMLAEFRDMPNWYVADADKEGRLSEEGYILRMMRWDFALCPRGGGLNSYRFYESIQCGCVPVLFADDVQLPYPDLPWGSIICRIPEEDAGNFERVCLLLDAVRVESRRKRIAAVRQRFALGGVQEEIHTRITEFLL